MCHQSSFQSAKGYYTDTLGRAQRPLDWDKSPTICYSFWIWKLFWCPGTWLLRKRMGHYASMLWSVGFFIIPLTANRYKETFDTEQTAHTAQFHQLKSSREALMDLSLWWMRRKRRTQWENLHRPHDRSCDKGQTLPTWHSPAKKKLIKVRITFKCSCHCCKLGRFSPSNRQTYIKQLIFTLQSMSTLCALRALCTMPCLFINSRPSRTS